MAELRRLKEVIAAAEVADAPALYLIDEMLRGTNAEERTVATRMIVERLINSPAIGVVTTHDATAFDAAPLAARVRHAHFHESFAPADAGTSGERMYFDYQLQPGPATSKNALRLLALVGIADADRATDAG
jgi:DNA mismatch repair ATPase MutS